MRLYWWNAAPNFGDVISQHIVSHVSGRDVVWAEPGEAQIFALGSIMRPVARTYKDGKAHRPWIWGTGCIDSVGRRFVNHVEFAAVRGPETAARLGVDVATYGDPGILIDRVAGPPPAPSGKVGLVLHHSQRNSDKARAVLDALPDLMPIDVTGDAIDVVHQIAGCAHVISSSLHGLIVADAYGVPNTWLDPEGIHKSPRFKFHDYAAAIGRDLPEPIGLEDIRNQLAPDGATVADQDRLEEMKTQLAAAFPDALKAS